MEGNDQPLVSVIMPAYNAENYIAESIEAVLGQTYRNLQLFIVDDGSSDNTFQIASEYMKADQRVKVFTQQNQGVSSARNLAISNVAGVYVAFCDSDDVWYSQKLKRQLHTIGDAVWSHCDSQYVGLGYENKIAYRSTYTRLYRGKVFKQLAIENFITTSSVLIKTDILKLYKGFDESLVALEDWKLWLEIARDHEIALCDEVLLNYRVQPQSTSRRARSLLPIHLDILHHTFRDKTLQDSELEREAISRAYLIFSYIAEEKKDHLFSLKCSVNFMLCTPNTMSIKRVIRTFINLLTQKKH